MADITRRRGAPADPYRPGETVVETAAAPAALKRISWGAIFAGVVVAMILQLVLGLLGLGIGFATIDPASEQNPFGGLGIGAGIWWLVTGIISMFAGGWIAGRFAGIPKSSEGSLHGIVTWGLVGLLTFFIATTAAGRAVSGVAGLVGQGLSATGQAVGAVAPDITDAVQEELRQQGITIQSIRQEAEQVLRQTGKPELQPEALKGQAQQATDTAQSGAAEAAKTPGQGGQDVGGIVDKLFGQAKDVTEEFDKEAAVNVLTERGMSREEAERTVEGWASQYQQAQQKVQQAMKKAEGTARQAGEKAAQGLSIASWAAFAMLVLGAIAAAIGGMVGAPSHTMVRDRA